MDIAVLGRNSLFRAGLVSLLSALGFEPLAEASSLEDLQQIATENRIEILLFHLPYETKGVSDSMEAIRSWMPDAKTVFLYRELNLGLMCECFAAGASGFLLENLSRDALQKSLNLVRIGEKIFPSELALIISNLAPQQPHDAGMQLDGLDLSERELQILRSLASGDSNKVIAAKLDIAESTVKVHLKHILRKTSSFNRTQAALWAVRRGIVAKPDRKSETWIRNGFSLDCEEITNITQAKE